MLKLIKEKDETGGSEVGELSNNYPEEVDFGETYRNLQMSYNASDLKQLRVIANLCPFEAGVAVYKARGILAMLDTVPSNFGNACEVAMPDNNSNARRAAGNVQDWDESLDFMYDENGVMQIPNLSKLNTISNIQFMPNPASSMVSFFVPEYSGNAKIVICQMNGETVLESNITVSIANTELSVANLANGMYIAKVYVNNQLKMTGKLSVIH
jgi:hypothetical protein